MAAANTMSTLPGMFKEVYATEIKDLTESIAKIAKRIPFTEAQQVGNKYHQPVDVAMEHGVTYAAANASGPVTLLSPVAGQMQDAQVEGAQIFARSQVDYETIFRATQAGPKAFASATKHIVKRLTKAAAKRLEISLLHGQRGIGTVGAIVTGTATTCGMTISDETWSAGIWAGAKNATLDIFVAAYSGSKLNTTSALTVTSVDPQNKTVYISGAAADITATVVGVQVFFETASPTNEMAGLDKILRNTGTLFGVDGSSTGYELWGSNVYSTSTAAISMGKLLESLATPVSYGAEGEYLAVVAPRAFEVLNTDLAALRMFDSSYSKGGNEGQSGFGSIKYFYQNGSLEIMAHPLQKDGLCHVFNPTEAKRIGATDLTFITRKGQEEVLVLELANTAGSEMRCYANQALFIEAPKRTTVLAGITY